MVGYIFSTLLPLTERGVSKACLDFPRVLSGHERAAELLIRKAFETLKKKGVSVVEARVTTRYLKPLLARLISNCVDKGYKTLLADLINEHRRYEDIYQALGFTKVAEWARCEKALA